VLRCRWPIFGHISSSIDDNTQLAWCRVLTVFLDFENIMIKVFWSSIFPSLLIRLISYKLLIFLEESRAYLSEYYQDISVRRLWVAHIKTYFLYHREILLFSVWSYCLPISWSFLFLIYYIFCVDVSYNLPKFCPNATWKATGTTFATTNTIGYNPAGI